MNLTITPGHCECGCGLPTKNAKRSFLQGHDAKLKSALIGAECAGEDVVIDHYPAGKRTETPTQVAAQYGFAEMVRKAVERRQDKAARKANRKPTNNEKAAAGRAARLAGATSAAAAVRSIRPTVKAKVGRWVYSGTVQGDTFIYKNGKGEIVRTQKFTVAA